MCSGCLSRQCPLRAIPAAPHPAHPTRRIPKYHHTTRLSVNADQDIAESCQCRSGCRSHSIPPGRPAMDAPAAADVGLDCGYRGRQCCVRRPCAPSPSLPSKFDSPTIVPRCLWLATGIGTGSEGQRPEPRQRGAASGCTVPGGHPGGWCRIGPPQCPQHRRSRSVYAAPLLFLALRVGWHVGPHTERETVPWARAARLS